MCGCSQMTTTTMELPSLVCLCVLISCGVSSADANEPVKVTVMEGNNVTLPCSLSTEENIQSKLFDWKKDGQKEVFLYNAGHHYNNGHSDQQDRQFKGRAFHFQDELKHGNASIIIRDTTCSDSGNYTCIFPHLQPSQTFHIELIVSLASRPYVKTVQTTNGMKLQCEVLGVSPIPKIEWKDSSGNVVHADEPKINKGEKEGCYDVILEAPVTKTDNFICIVTQEKIYHQIKNDISVTHERVKVVVMEGNNVTLPCSLSTKEDIESNLFDWKKDGQKEVFMYDGGLHYNNGHPGQDRQFKGRVFHFQDELQHGNASIIIRNTTVTDSGDYTCDLPLLQPSQTFHIELVVEKSSRGDSNRWIASTVVLSVLLLVAAVVIIVLLRKRLRKKSLTESPPPEGEQRPMNSDSHRPED